MAPPSCHDKIQLFTCGHVGARSVRRLRACLKPVQGEGSGVSERPLSTRCRSVWAGRIVLPCIGLTTRTGGPPLWSPYRRLCARRAARSMPAERMCTTTIVIGGLNLLHHQPWLRGSVWLRAPALPLSRYLLWAKASTELSLSQYFQLTLGLLQPRGVTKWPLHEQLSDDRTSPVMAETGHNARASTDSQATVVKRVWGGEEKAPGVTW